MKKLILSLTVLCAFAQTAHAFDFDNTNNDEVAAPGRPAPSPFPGNGGGHNDRDDRNGPGNNGPGNGGPGNGGPGNGGPHNPSPSPIPTPQPPHNQPRIEYVTCASQGNRYNTCAIDPRGIRNFYLARQLSNARCEQNRSFGLTGDRIWVDQGCRGVFAIERF